LSIEFLLPHTGQSPSPCSLWKRRAWSRRVASWSDFPATVWAAAFWRWSASLRALVAWVTASSSGGLEGGQALEEVDLAVVLLGGR
jgi:hypothetical protein